MRSRAQGFRLGAAALAVAMLAAGLFPVGSTGAVLGAQAAPADDWSDALLGTHLEVQQAMAESGWPEATLPQAAPLWAASLPAWAQAMMAQPGEAPVRSLALADAALSGSGLDALDAAWGLEAAPPAPAPAVPAPTVPVHAAVDIVAAVLAAQAMVQVPDLDSPAAQEAQAEYQELRALLDGKPWEQGIRSLATDIPEDREAMLAWLDATVLAWAEQVQAHVARIQPAADAARLDPAASQAALRLVLRAIETAAPQLQAAAAVAAEPGGAAPLGGGDPCLGTATPPVFVDPQNLIAVFGTEPNCHRDPCPPTATNCHQADNALIRIDLGGNDVYQGHTGAALGGLDVVRVSIDVAGNDRYTGADLAQGAGYTGVGVLADLGGSDVYTCTTRCQGFGGAAGAGALLDAGGADVYLASFAAQGAGAEIGGSGALVDLGMESDRYTAVQLAQGSGEFGHGFLYDAGGDEVYIAGYIAQAAGLAAGTGVLVDVSGSDRYHSVPGGTFGAGQSAAVLGASALIDGSGDDQYAVGVINVGVAQSSSAIGASVFVDGTGNDRYATNVRDVTAVFQSAALGLGAVSVMMDGAGNDLYGGPVGSAPVASAIGQGQTTAVGGAAFLYDAGGDDAYVGGDRCPIVLACYQYGQGSVLIAGLAVLADTGGNDRYFGGDWTQGAGSGVDLVEMVAGSLGFPTGHNTEAYALLLDTAGNDQYLGGKQRNVPLDCQPVTRAYHGIAYLSGAARLIDRGSGSDSYAARVGGTPAANNLEWTHGCRTIQYLGNNVNTGIQAGGGQDG